MRDRALAPIALDHRHLLAVAGRAGEGGIDRAAAGLRHPRRRSPDSAARCECAANCLARPSWATSVLATTSSPDVSLSIRWTIPGRATPPIPDRLAPQWWSRALTRVRSRLPAAGWTTSPAGLSIDQQMLVLEHDLERDILRLVVRRCRLGDRQLECSRRPLTLVAGIAKAGGVERRHCGSVPSAARATASALPRPARGRGASRHGPVRELRRLSAAPRPSRTDMGLFRSGSSLPRRIAPCAQTAMPHQTRR